MNHCLRLWLGYKERKPRKGAGLSSYNAKFVYIKRHDEFNNKDVQFLMVMSTTSSHFCVLFTRSL